MKLKILTALLMLACVGPGWGADKEPMSPEQKVLDKLIGTWEYEETTKPGPGIPSGQNEQGTITRQWVLNGRFVEEKGGSKDSQHIILWTYNTEKKAYEGWMFHSSGTTMKWLGQWDEAKKSFTWKAERDGAMATIPFRFLDDDTAVWEVVVQDKEGKTHIIMEGKQKRKK